MHPAARIPIHIPLYGRSGAVVGAVLVDAADADLVAPHRWGMAKRLSGKRYAVRFVREGARTRSVFMHRVILGLPLWPGRRTATRLEPDHINGDGLDNRRSNLRAVTHAQNMQNKRANRSGTSVHRGVYWHARDRRWVAQARLAGRKVELGRFDNPDEAAEVVSAWRAENMPYAVEAA